MGSVFSARTWPVRWPTRVREVVVLDSLVPEYGGNLANIAGFAERLTVNTTDLRDSNASLRSSATRISSSTWQGRPATSTR